MSTLLEFLNPFHRRGWYALPHLLALAAVFALLALAGVFAVHYTAAYFRQHYMTPLRAPGVSAPVHTSVGTLPTSASIHFQFFTTAINDQGNIGSCSSWAFSKQISYAANWNVQANGKHLHHFFSPRFGYDLVSSGQDAGSYLEQYPPLARTIGVDRWIAFPYGDAARYVGYNPYAVDYPVPAIAFTAAHPVHVTEHQLFPDQGAGMAGVDLIRQALSTHHMVNIDTLVPPQFDNANQTQGNVAYYPNQPSRGGHAVVAVAYDDKHVDPYSGQVGAVLISNQWSDNYGIAVPSITGSSAGGFAWLSYSFVAHDVWDAAVVHVSTAPFIGPPIHPKPHHSILYVPSHAPLHKAPKITHRVALGAPKAGQIPQVVGIVTNDTHVNISDSINRAAAAAGVSAPGYAALVGVESGIHQIAPHSPIAPWDVCDWSGGGTQVNVCTAQSLGVGDGTASLHNVFIVLSWEQGDANRDISWSGLLVARMHRNVCYDFPVLYAAWNMGDGYGCSLVYRYPTNPITQNAVRIYNGWWQWVWASHVVYAYPPGPHPKPKPVRHYKFPKRTYEQYRHRHHLKGISPYYHHKLSFAASTWWTVQNKKGREVLGGIVRPERWNRQREAMTGYYQAGKIFTWPTHHGWSPVVRRHRRIR